MTAGRRPGLLGQLAGAQADAAAAHHRAGALAERTRLCREIHETVGQGVTSVNLLLNAADQE